MPAPPRFLPEYDNVLLSHANRSRFLTADRRRRLGAVGGRVDGAVLQDGFVCGVWRLERESGGRPVTLVVSHAERLTKRAAAAIAAEGRRLVRFLESDEDDVEVRLVAVD